MITDFEGEARRRKYAQIAACHAADAGQLAGDKRLRRDRAASAPELLAILDRFQVSGEVEAFRRELRMWAPKPGWYEFNGGNGHMFVSPLVNKSPDLAAVARLLQRCLAVPDSEAAAAAAIRELHDYVVTIKKGPQPAPNRAGFLCSFFWSLQDPEHWPALWASTQAGLDQLGWLPKIDDIADRYVTFRRVVLDLGEPAEVELVFRWFERHPFTGLDPSLVDRCALSMAIDQRRSGGDYATEEDRTTIEANVRAVRSDLLLLGRAGADRVSTALGRGVRVEAAQPCSAPGVFRPDGWMRWALPHAKAPVSLRVWVTHQGVFVGLHADRQDEAWIADAWEAIRDLVPSGMQRFVRRQGLPDPTPDPTTPTEFLLGRFYPGASALDRVSLLDEIEHLAADLQPVVDRLVGPVGPGPEPVTVSTDTNDDTADAVERLAAELLVDRAFLDDVIALLRERGQVIFYGPPGTGKTFVARKLAEVLAPEPGCRMVVQFHPSTSYEDFFEGYRPESDAGTLSYRLTKGPLALLTEKAASSPGVTHVMVIDEINRANLPKVFGELLYLLEYRDDEVRTLYRPDDVFSLPGNLLFIGTMNTADRSIALVDAALRRRFHFVPFFPNEGAIDGLLRRWLEAENQPTWVADLVDTVNSELVDELGGPDLQLGPSYFMRTGLDEKALERIWTYDIFPLIQDTLFGNPERIEQYRFHRVLARFKAQANVSSVRELEELTAGEA